MLLLPPWSFLQSPSAPPGSGERPPGPEAASVVQGLVSVTLGPEGLGSGGRSPGAPVSPPRCARGAGSGVSPHLRAGRAGGVLQCSAVSVDRGNFEVLVGGEWIGFSRFCVPWTVQASDPCLQICGCIRTPLPLWEDGAERGSGAGALRGPPGPAGGADVQAIPARVSSWSSSPSLLRYNWAPFPFAFFTTRPVNLLILDASCEQNHAARRRSCLAPLH